MGGAEAGEGQDWRRKTCSYWTFVPAELGMHGSEREKVHK